MTYGITAVVTEILKKARQDEVLYGLQSRRSETNTRAKGVIATLFQDSPNF